MIDILMIKKRRLLFLIFLFLFLFLFQGCAIHSFDQKSGTEHVWGIGHMKMKVSKPTEGVRGVVKGTELWGFSIGFLDEGMNLSIGRDYKQRLYIMDEDTSIRLEWPDNDFCNARVGSDFINYSQDFDVNSRKKETFK